MNKNNEWMRGEIAHWQREGLIDAAQAQALYRRYPASAADGGWGRVIFSALGAIIFGLGVILIFAYNWQAMHRFTKLGVIAAALLLAHGAGLALCRSGGAHRRVGESLHLLGTMLFGAGIWLVAQIYHIDEHYPTAFLVWSLGALGLAWALPSVAQGLLTAALVFLWSWFEVFDFRQHHPWGASLIALGVLPLAWLQRSRSLLAAGLVLFPVLYAFSAARVDGELVMISLWLIAIAYLGVAPVAERGRFAASAGILQTLGGAGFLVLLFIATFAGASEELFPPDTDAVLGVLYLWLPLAAAVAAWGMVALRVRTRERYALLEHGLAVMVLLLLVAACLGMRLGVLAWVLFNLAFLAQGALFIVRGTRELLWKQVALGCGMISVLVFARFTDLFESLLLRSLLFLVLGAGLFLVGLYYSNRKSRHNSGRQGGGEHA